jgi:hypothetical protein
MMLRAGVQALSNLLTGNEESKDYIWESFLVQLPSSSCDQNLLRYIKEQDGKSFNHFGLQYNSGRTLLTVSALLYTLDD